SLVRFFPLTHEARRNIQHIADHHIQIALEGQLDSKCAAIFARIAFLGKKRREVCGDGSHTAPSASYSRTHVRLWSPNEYTMFYDSGRNAIDLRGLRCT